MSKLRVNDVLPANGLNIGIGTAGGNFIVGGASTTVVINGDINITGNVTGSSGATFTNITVGANNGFHVDGGAPANSLTVNNVGDTVVGSGHSVYIANGNLVFQTTGTGIDFSGVGIASTSASSSILHDYEEGTFTPEFANAASGGTESSSYTTQHGRYTKIGNLVHVDIFLRNVVSNGLGTGQFFIRGLPFTVKSGSIYIGQAGLSRVDLNAAASSLYSFANAEGGALSALRVFQTKDNVQHSAVPCDAVNSGLNEIFITMTYPTDS